MARRLPGDRAHHFRTTDHSQEIAWLREQIGKHDDDDVALVYGTAAELLQAHDDTGISLDEWMAPRGLVEKLLGKPILDNRV